MSNDPKADAIALKAARALSVRNPPRDDTCAFSFDVGAELFRLNNAREGIPGFSARYLALGILDAEAQHSAELDAKFAAEDEDERERRYRLRELIRLVTIDGKPIMDPANVPNTRWT